MSRESSSDANEENVSDRILIGWREYVALPDWGIRTLRAKIDTGARTSAIDVLDIEERPDSMVRFHVIPNRRRPGRVVTVEAEIVRRTRIKSSFGARKDRIVVRTMMRLGEVTKPVELGLVCRKNMLCRMLLGRRALTPEFNVDPASKYLLGKMKQVKEREARRKREQG